MESGKGNLYSFDPLSDGWVCGEDNPRTVPFSRRGAFPVQYSSFKATARIAVESPTEKYSQTVALAVKNPSFLRIESLPLFGPADLMLSTKGSVFQVFLPREKTYYTGAATQHNMHRFFGIALSPRHIIPLLTGVPPLEVVDTGELRIYREMGRYRIDLFSENRNIQSLWLNPESQMLEELLLRDEAAGTSLSVTFDNFVHLQDRSYPTLIHVTMVEPERTSITVRYSDIEVSDDRAEGLFDLAVPLGITPILLGE